MITSMITSSWDHQLQQQTTIEGNEKGFHIKNDDYELYYFCLFILSTRGASRGASRKNKNGKNSTARNHQQHGNKNTKSKSYI